MTRYVGITLVGAFFVLMIIIPASLYKRFINLAIYLIFALPGIGWWLIRNQIVSGNSVNRQLIYHPIEFYKIQEGINNFWKWIMPNWIKEISNPSFTVALLLFILLVLIYIGFTVISFIKLYKRISIISSTDIFRALIGIYGLGYVLALVLSLTFFDSSSIFEDRIILPFMISLGLVSITIIYQLWSWIEGHFKVVFLITFIALFLFVQIPDSVRTAKEYNTSGQGFLTWGWKSSETIKAVRNLDDYAIYSNKPNAIYILANKPSYTITSPYNPATLLAREGYQESINNIRKRVLDGEAVIVFFDYSYYKENDQIQEYKWIFELTDGLPILNELYDGTIFGEEKRTTQ